MKNGSRSDAKVSSRIVLGVIAALTTLVVTGAPERGAHVADATSSCPTGTGYGGNITTIATNGVSSAGNGCVIIVHGGGTEVFVHTGAPQTWTVPAGVTSIELHLIGAGGGGGLQNKGGSFGTIGGGGGYATGTLGVSPGDQLSVIVGKGGRHQCVADLTSADLVLRSNFNFGGGAAGYGHVFYDCSWASGGGRSAVRALGGADDIITAGGGGGGGYGTAGGAGGGAVGVAGTDSVGTGGGGGTQSAGGAAGGPSEAGYAGVQYAGGPAGLVFPGMSEAGGGGGGYFGGGGGGNNAGGGGGSSYVGTARGLVGGSTTAGSGRTPGAVPPVNSSVPTISGTARVGETLTAATGVWSGARSTSFRWQVSTNGGTTWTDIVGALGSTYVVGTSGQIRVVETAQNYFGTTAANSASTTAIVDTTLSGLVVSSGTLSPAFSSGVFAYSVSVPYTSTSVTVTPTRTHSSAAITVNGTSNSSGAASAPISLSVGANTVTIVTTNTGVSATTTVTITREAATVPGAPTISTVTGGQGRLTVAFTAPVSDGGEPITDYEYSRNSGSWISVGTTSSPFTITGLADATSYSLRVRARNSVGTGAASNPVSGATFATTTTTSTSTTVPSTTTTTPEPTGIPPEAPIVQATTPTFAPFVTGTTSTTVTANATARRPVATTTTSTTSTSTTTTIPSAPMVGVDGAVMVVDGQEIPVTVEKKDGAIIATDGYLRAVISGVTSDGVVAPFDADGNIRIGNKGRVRVGVEGFSAGSLVEVWLYSDPTRLGALSVGTNGGAQGDLLVPSSVRDGLHRAVLRGTSERGLPVQVAVNVVVGEPGRISPAGRALLIAALVLAAMAALFLPAVLRRRWFPPVLLRRRRRDEESDGDVAR